MKRDRNKVTTPVVNKSFKWNYKHLKELSGQGKIYVRLNIDREIIELNPDPQDMSTDEDDEQLPPPLSLRETTRSGTVASSLNNEQSSSLDQYNSSAAVPRHACVSNSSHDRERLGEILPFATAQDIDSALSQYGSIEEAASVLVSESTMIPKEKEESVYPSLANIVKTVGKKLVGRKIKLEVYPDDIINDAISYYKSIDFDPHCPLRIAYRSQLAIDSGGVLRQFFSDLFEKIDEGKLMVLFEGEIGRRVPTYRPHVVMSGLLEMVGKMIAHSLVQGGPGFPFLANPCYYYLVTGDIMCAMAYSDAWDIPDTHARIVVLKVCNRFMYVLY